MKKRFVILAAALMTLVPVSASAAARFVVVGRPYYGGGFYYGGFYNPFWGSYWGPGYGYFPNSGEVKLDTKLKDASVFINGSFAGSTHDNKTMHLRPGNYNIEIREGAQTLLGEKVYVVAGKTLHLQIPS
jgi:hypothetical protein